MTRLETHEIEITEEMIEAGAEMVRMFDPAEGNARMIAEWVFEEMIKKSLQRRVL